MLFPFLPVVRVLLLIRKVVESQKQSCSFQCCFKAPTAATNTRLHLLFTWRPIVSDRNVSPESSVHEEQVRWGWWGGPGRRWLPWRSKPAGSPGGEQLMITDSSLRKFVWIQWRPECLFWPGLIRFSNLNVAARKVFRKVCSTFRRWHCQWPKNTRKKMIF